MDGLLGKLKGLLGDEAAKWKRSATLLSGIPKTFKNNPRNLETVDAAFGLGGIVPGVGDYLSALEAKYRWDQGDKLGAGLAGLGALPLIPAIGGMFIGKGAKTWDVLKNAEAVKMEQAGVDPRTIWKETGNWKAPDGQWRQEIPDNTARLKGLSYQGRQGMDEGHGELSGILEHANLYSAYPDTAKIQSSITQGPRIQESGSYSIDGPQYHEFFPQLQASGTDAKSPILHELQHAIQQREGWARGGSPEQMLNEHRSIFANTNLENVSPVKGMNLGDYVTDRYRRLAGEAEARATQARMNMDMAERLKTFPADSYDVPLDSLIVRYGDGPAMHTVYHGSPHKFDKFDMSKIGTGEGAQAYGHGLYMAEAPDVAKTYADTLGEEVLVKGKPVYKAHNNTIAGDAPIGNAARNALQGSNWDLAKAKSAMQDAYKTSGDGYFKRAFDELSALSESDITRKTGALYKVDIPDEAVARMLDWDKPLSEQAPEVQEVIRRLDLIDESVWPHYTGQQLYEGEMNARGPYKANGFADNAAAPPVSELLKQHGIPGIRYLDGGSRSAGEGTSNFVLFDDQLPRILERNGEPTGLQPWAPGEANALLGLPPLPPRRPVNHLGQEIPPTQYELAHAEAQRVAALPVEQGGLGLPPDNTAMDRARAMGFDTDGLHGTGSRFSEVNTKGKRYAEPFWLTYGDGYIQKEFANNFADMRYQGNPNIIPVKVKKPLDTRVRQDADYVKSAIGDWPQYDDIINDEGLLKWGRFNDYSTELQNKGIESVLIKERPNMNSVAVLDPRAVRSRFAAFNPAKRDSADLLASYLLPATFGGLLGANYLLSPDEGL